jgi:hypothetical protein
MIDIIVMAFEAEGRRVSTRIEQGSTRLRGVSNMAVRAGGMWVLVSGVMCFNTYKLLQAARCQNDRR